MWRWAVVESIAWDVGDAAKIYAEFTDDDGQPINATVTVAVKKPDGTLVAPALTPTNPATGRYEAIVDIDQPGTWNYRWAATGTIKAAQEGQLAVRRSKVL